MATISVFVSYSHSDTRAVQDIQDYLFQHQSNVDVWIDLNIQGGRVWSEEIKRAIDNCDIFFLILSRDSLASEEVAKEYTQALTSGKKILVYRLDVCEVPDMLSKYSYLGRVKVRYSPDLAGIVADCAALIRDKTELKILSNTENTISYTPYIMTVGGIIGAVYGIVQGWNAAHANGSGQLTSIAGFIFALILGALAGLGGLIIAGVIILILGFFSMPVGRIIFFRKEKLKDKISQW